jgi:hypothetical protein
MRFDLDSPCRTALQSRQEHPTSPTGYSPAMPEEPTTPDLVELTRGLSPRHSTFPRAIYLPGCSPPCRVGRSLVVVEPECEEAKPGLTADSRWETRRASVAYGPCGPCAPCRCTRGRRSTCPPAPPRSTTTSSPHPCTPGIGPSRGSAYRSGPSRPSIAPRASSGSVGRTPTLAMRLTRTIGLGLPASTGRAPSPAQARAACSSSHRGVPRRLPQMSRSGASCTSAADA